MQVESVVVSVVILSLAALGWASPVVERQEGKDDFIMYEARMKNAISPYPDSHICGVFKLPVDETTEMDIVEIIPHATKRISHHLAVIACEVMPSSEDYWSCDKMTELCPGRNMPIYFWALNAQGITLPKGVGIRVGGVTGLYHIVIQMHYMQKFDDGYLDRQGVTLKMTPTLQPYQAGMYIMASKGYIPANKTGFESDIACAWNGEDMEIFACRGHTHYQGRSVSGYKIRNDTWQEIGRIDPLKPQRFFNTSSQVQVKRGDILAARCVHDGRDTDVLYGNTDWMQDMCDLYLFYKTPVRGYVPLKACVADAQEFHWKDHLGNIPSDASSFTNSPQEQEFLREKDKNKSTYM